MDDERSQTMRESIQSLLDTAEECEIIVVDNGGSLEDSVWLLSLTHQQQIACYVRNRKNMHFGYARNQALSLCTGDYLVIADNDIEYKPGWWQECRDFLSKHKGKYLATPIAPDPMNDQPKRYTGDVVDGWRLNTRAGSNCFMMRRNDFEKIGLFKIHHIAGSHYVDRYRELDYLMAIMPESKAIDLGLRKGYNIKEKITNKEL